MSPETLRAKRARLWERIHELRAARKAARSAAAKAKVRDEYRRVVRELEATRAGLKPAKRAKRAA